MLPISRLEKNKRNEKQNPKNNALQPTGGDSESRKGEESTVLHGEKPLY